MASTSSLTLHTDMSGLMDAVARELVSTGVDGRDGIIALPILYPGGQPVTVRVRPDAGEFIVTDQGNGYLSAEHMGAADTFVRLAPKVAKQNSVGFDGQMMFAARVPRDWLMSAIIFTAAASKEAVEKTADKLTIDLDATMREGLQARIKDVFRGRASFNVEVPGNTTKMRKFAARVDGGSRISLFDVVTPSPVSVNFAIVKFQDVAQLGNDYQGVAVVSGKIDAPDMALLSQWASRVLPFDADREMLALAA